MNRLTKELKTRGLVFSCPDTQYEECQQLHEVHSWRYILKYSCAVLPNMYKLYDKQHHLICTLDEDDDDYTIEDGALDCHRTAYFSDSYEFTYDLNKGAPIHVNDVAALLFLRGEGNWNDIRIIVLKSGDIYVKRDCYSLKKIHDNNIAAYISIRTSQGYKTLDKEYHMSNIEIFNDLIVTNK